MKDFLTKVPLRVVLIIPFALQILGIAGVVGYLSFRNGEAAIDDLAGQLTSEISQRIKQNLQTYLETPHRINRQNRSTIRLHSLNLKNLNAWEKPLLEQVQIYHPDILYVGVGNELGEYRSGEQLEDHSLRINVAIEGRGFRSYQANHDGERLALKNTVANFKLRQREEYQQIIRAESPIWTPVFASLLEPSLLISGAEPIYDSQAKMRGILVAALRLDHIGQFMQSLKIGDSGQSFIIDQQGTLLATSTGELPFRDRQGKRRLFKAVDSANPLTRSIAEHLLESERDRSTASTPSQQEAPNSLLVIAGNAYYLKVMPLRDGRGLDWRIVTVIPKADFTEQIYQNSLKTAIGCAVAIVGFIILGIGIARQVALPIRRLNAAAKEVAQGNFDRQVPLPSISEFGELAQSFNQMTRQLQQFFDEQKDLNHALASSEHRLRQILEALPIGVAVISQDQSYTYLNQAGRTLLRMESLKNPPEEQLSEAYYLYRAGTQQIYPYSELPILRALRGDCTTTEDLELHRDGQVISLEVHASPVLDQQGNVVYAVATFKDISQRKQAEASLREQEAQFRRIAESVPGMLFRYAMLPDGQFRFTYVSPRCRDLFELEPEEAVQDSSALCALVHPDDMPLLQQAVAASIETMQPIFLEYRVITASGKVKWIQAPSCPARLPNREIVWDGIAVDITDRKQAAQLLETYNQVLEQEVQRRTIALEQEITERKQIEAALKQANLKLERLATLDGLTQIPNRRRFDEYLEQEWRRLTREQQPLALLLIDVDDFKRFNDCYGHQEGDRCLYWVAQAINRSIKRPADLVARYGGEEFAAVLPNTDLEGATTVAQTIRAEVERLQIPHAESSIGKWVTLSLGIACTIPTQATSPNSLLMAADYALYEAKHQGRDRYCVQPVS